jgi:hypothetical protein
MTPLEITHHTVRCPLGDSTADLSVSTAPGAAPSGRHRDVTACSLWPSTSFMPSLRRGYFADVAPPVSYLDEVGAEPCHAMQPACAKRCLAVLNAAEAGVTEPPRCTSGINDALELARLTQTPAMMRLLWFYSGG